MLFDKPFISCSKRSALRPTLVSWLRRTWDSFAQSKGLPSIIVHGQLACSFLSQLMTDWIGEEGTLQRLTCNYRGMNFPDEPLTCKGKVIKKYVEDGEHYEECNIWVENPRGEKTVSGTATVIVPSRGR